MDPPLRGHAADALARGPAALPARPVLITFDDGFADFRDAALPALLTRDMAATLYATTGFLGRSSPAEQLWVAGGGGGAKDLEGMAANSTARETIFGVARFRAFAASVKHC